MAGKVSSILYKCAAVVPIISVALLGQAPAVASPNATSVEDLSVVHWTDKLGGIHETRALSRQEIVNKGLSKYIDISRQQSVRPSIGAASKPEAPHRAKGSGSLDGISTQGCWQDGGRYGNDDLWGRYQVDWCGDGSWITYGLSSCWGGEDNTPTFQYLGCATRDRYGVNWNRYDVRHEFDLCYLYNPLWGSCLAHDRPWNWYSYSPRGRVTWIAS